MVQLELPLSPTPTLTITAFRELVATATKAFGHKPIRCRMTRGAFKDLVDSMPAGRFCDVVDGGGVVRIDGVIVEVFG